MQVVQCFGRRMVRDIYGARHRVGRQPSEIASAEQLGTSVLAGRQRRAVGEMNEREVVGAAFEQGRSQEFQMRGAKQSFGGGQKLIRGII